VLLAGLSPILQVGIERALVDGGATVLDGELADPDALVRRAGESSPDAIVLGDGSSGSLELGARLRAAAPGTTLVLWRTDASVVAVLGPHSDSARVIPAPTAEELMNELFARAGKGETCPNT
jgi:hypothetical protein